MTEGFDHSQKGEFNTRPTLAQLVTSSPHLERREFNVLQVHDASIRGGPRVPPYHTPVLRLLMLARWRLVEKPKRISLNMVEKQHDGRAPHLE